MLSESRPEVRQNCGDNVFEGISVDTELTRVASEYFLACDFSANTFRAVRNDLRKFATWFLESNQEPLSIKRITTRDVADFRNFSRSNQNQAVATVNRALVSIRKFLGWIQEKGYSSSNVAKGVKELRKQELAPKGLERAQVRKLLREIELRCDIRANAIIHFLIYTGCRVSDLVRLCLTDLLISERSGSAIIRSGKGNKQRSVPVSTIARKVIAEYLQTRPPIASDKVFIGERGALTEKGIRSLCEKYSVICGFKIHPHLLRHTMAHQYLADNPGDLIGLAQILGHENLNTTRRYVAKTEQQLADGAERIQF